MPEIFVRHRLFELVDSWRNKRPVLWISGPPGAGKTTLMASYLEARNINCLWYQIDEGDEDLASFFYYMGRAAEKILGDSSGPLPLLTPEYLNGLPAFTRKFFAGLLDKIETGRPPVAQKKAHFTLVFDNYQKLQADCAFHDMIIDGIYTLAESVRVVVISRIEPPPRFARMRTEQWIGFIDWQELRLTPDESGGIVQAWGHKKLDSASILKLHSLTDGWAAGITLLLEKIKNDVLVPAFFETLSRETVFTYFAGEFFDKEDHGIMQFQMHTAFLPQMTSRMAETISGRKDAQGLLNALHRKNFFMECRLADPPVYAYHPLFREFLISRAEKAYSHETIGLLKWLGAGLLEKIGLFEEAADLFLQTGSWSEMDDLIQRHASSLIVQGRNSILEKWIKAVFNSGRPPSAELLFWMGVSRLSHDPANARTYLEDAFDAAADHAPVKLLVWSAIIDTYCLEWNDFRPLDKWIDWMEKTLASGFVFQDKEIEARVVTTMSAALMLRQPHHPEIDTWTERSMALTRELADINFRVQKYLFLGFFYFWRGDLVHFRFICKEIENLVSLPEATPLSRLALPCMESFLAIWLEGEYETALEKIDAALQYAETNGVMVWNHMLLSLKAYCFLAQGEVLYAEESLAAMTGQLDSCRKHLYSQYYYLLAWCSYLKSDKGVARVQAATALEYAETTGYVFPQILCLIENAWILYESGDSKKACDFLSRAKDLSRRTNSAMMTYAAALIEAGLFLREGREQEGLVILNEAMTLGRENGFITPPWWCEPPFMPHLCAAALNHDIEREHVSAIICKQRLVIDPPEAGPFLKWPWPVRVFTLGRFQLYSWGQPVLFPGKIQKKPLEMLKVLIAMGGGKIGKEKITDILWPDADGDMAHKSFATTLHRLRQVLGEKRAIRLSDGRVSLDPRYCWVDALFLLKRATEIDQQWRRPPDSKILEETQSVIELYQGRFLEGDPEEKWIDMFQDRLQQKYLKLLERLGQYRERRGEWEAAILYYEKAIESDPLAESFYVFLMECYCHLGWSGQIVRTYNRCREQLRNCYDIEPSASFENRYKTLLSRLS